MDEHFTYAIFWEACKNVLTALTFETIPVFTNCYIVYMQ